MHDDDRVPLLPALTLDEVWTSEDVQGAKVLVEQVGDSGRQYLSIRIELADLSDFWVSGQTFRVGDEQQAIAAAEEVREILELAARFWSAPTRAVQ